MPADSSGSGSSPGQPDQPQQQNNPTNPGNRNRGNRGSNRGNRHRGQHGGNRRSTTDSRFEGREPSLAGYIYDYTGERNPDQWIKTTKEIINHVGRTYTKFTAEFTEAVKSLELTDPVIPAPPDPQNPVQFELWKLEIKEQRVRAQEYTNFRAGLFNLVLGQCTEALEDRLSSHQDFPAAQQDGIALLTIIKTLLHSFEERRKLADALSDVKEKFYGFKQGKHMSLQRYHELFMAQVQVLEEVQVTVEDQALVEQVAATNRRPGVPNNDDCQEARQLSLATRFIRGTNAQHQEYLRHLRNSYLDGQDHYPTTVHQAYNILQRREGSGNGGQVDSEGVAFTQRGTGVKDLSHIQCFSCREHGHYASDCPSRGQQGENQGTQLLASGSTTGEEGTGQGEVGFSFSQQASSGYDIPKTWVILDNGSTVDVFCNQDLLHNIRQVGTRMKVHGTGGTRCTNLMGELPGYGLVWFDPGSMTNILSFKRVKTKYQITF